MANAFGSTLAMLLVLILTIIVAVYFFQKSQQPQATQERVPFPVLRTIIAEKIQDVAELVTLRKAFDATINFNDATKIPFFDVGIPGTKRDFVIDYSGMIVSGCDLKAIRILPDGFDNNRVKIIVPQSCITDFYADIKSFKIRGNKAGIFAANIKIEEQNEWIRTDLESRVKQAIDEGILIRSNDNVRKYLNAIVSAQGFTADIEFIGDGSDSHIKLLNSANQSLWR